MTGTGAHTQRPWIWLAALAVVAQLIASFVFNVHASYFISDDIGAIQLAHQTDFLTYIATPIDIHIVPLHRATNYLLHNALPMNFVAATAFLLACHALAMLVLYFTLMRLNAAPRLNAVIVVLCALNQSMMETLHWWAAGLHRFPYVLLATLACYCFVRAHQERRTIFAALALVCMVLASGFFAKGLLIPLYWAALLFCLFEPTRWREYWQDYGLIAAGLICVFLFLIAYPHKQDSVFTSVAPKTAFDIVFYGLLSGFSIIAKLPFQQGPYSPPAPWINIAWIVALGILLWKTPRSWRAIVAGFGVLGINLLLVLTSPRAAGAGTWILLVPYYYYELLIFIALFMSLALKEFAPAAAIRLTSTRAHIAVASITVATLIAYDVTGWQNLLARIKPGANENHWLCARYVRNLNAALEQANAETLNLLDRSLPGFFRVGAIAPQTLPLSEFLAWSGRHPQFQRNGKPLDFIDDAGHIQAVAATAQPVVVLANETNAEQDNAAPCTAQRERHFSVAAPVASERGYLTIDYQADTDTVIEITPQLDGAGSPPKHITLPAVRHQVIVDLSQFAYFTQFTLVSITTKAVAGDACLRSISFTAY